MNVVTRSTTYFTVAKNRPVNGIVLHHAATAAAVLPHSNGSWHYMIGRDGVIYHDVPEHHVAWHVANTNKWRPPWVVPSKVATSDMNYCSLGVELAYAPQDPHFQVPTWEQEDSLRVLLADIYRRYGRLPIVGHGEVQSDKWASEPHGLNWGAVGISARGVDGRYFSPPAPKPEDLMTPEEESILDSARRHSIQNGGELDWYVGTYTELDKQVRSLHDLLTRSQAETAAHMAEAERLRGVIAELQAQPAPPGNVTRIELRATAHLSDGSAVPVPVGVA